jgi:hypothetical protein
LSFFDDGEDTEPRPSTKAARPRPAGTQAGATTGARPQPRRPTQGTLALDQRTVLTRRLVAAGIGVVVLILIIVLVSGCLKSEKQTALKEYNRDAGQIAHESDETVTGPLFSALSGAGSKSALNVEVQIDQLRIQAQTLVSHTKALSVPSEMAGAQRNLLLTQDLRAEAVTKIAALAPTALGGGGQNKEALTKIAGDMEILLASDVIYSQRVAPLIQSALAAASITGVSTATSHALPNLGWLDPTTVQSRVTGQAASSSSAPVQPGNHGSALKEVTVGTNKLEAEPTLNHVTGGSNPTFTAAVENSGEFEEHNVKVDVTVTAEGKQFKASHAIEKTEPGKSVNVDIPVAGVPIGVAAKIEVSVEGVPGENDLENNKGVFLAVFEK